MVEIGTKRKIEKEKKWTSEDKKAKFDRHNCVVVVVDDVCFVLFLSPQIFSSLSRVPRVSWTTPEPSLVFHKFGFSRVLTQKRRFNRYLREGIERKKIETVRIKEERNKDIRKKGKYFE